MVKIYKYIVVFFLLVSVCGCSLFTDVKNEVEDEMNKVEDKVDTSVQEHGKLSDFMVYLKDHGITYGDETTLDNFDFSAKEGKSFTYDGNKVYVYSVDMENAAVRALMNQAITNRKILANRGGNEMEYGASANGNYLMVYDLEAKVDDLLDRFEEYNSKK